MKVLIAGGITLSKSLGIYEICTGRELGTWIEIGLHFGKAVEE